MLRVRFSDEKYLCKYDLDINLFESLGVEINDLWPARSVFILDTKQGRKILKIIDYSEKRLNFICRALEYMKLSYNNILEINSLTNKEKFMEWNNNKYILLDLIEGVECNVANPIELEIATKGIALMHNSSKEFLKQLNREEEKENIDLFKFHDYLKKSREELIAFKEQVEKISYKNEFDDVFISEVDYHINEIEQCEELLSKCGYEELCKNNNVIAICHNDLAYHNIIIKDSEANFIDFDYCSIDLRVKDLWNFIIKSIKKFGFSSEMCENILNIYNKINPLIKEEYMLLYIYLKFPHDFYTISREYYWKLKQWSYESYLSKFQNKLEYTKEKKLLLEFFYNNYIK